MNLRRALRFLEATIQPLQGLARCRHSPQEVHMRFGIRSTASVLCLSLLSACATQASPVAKAEPVYAGDDAATFQNTGYANEVSYGWVRSIESVGEADQARGSGALIGGMIGAIIGRQVADSNHGKNVATVIGAAAGALIGHEIEKSSRRERSGVRITVTLDNGSVRSFELRDSSGFRVGERVRIEGNQVFRAS
jgi:outer membrane lipoprotein SlyB